MEELVEEFLVDPTPRLIYQMVNAGYDLQTVNCRGETLLQQCLVCFPSMPAIYHALFQCGAFFEPRTHVPIGTTKQVGRVDKVLSWSVNDKEENVDGDDTSTRRAVIKSSEELNECCPDSLKNEWWAAFADYPALSEDVRSVISAYYPGLWNAVLLDDLSLVRRFVNMWCRVDITRHGQTLKELALQRGTERIIDLVIKMADSLRFAHAVLAGDNQLVKLLLDSSTLYTTLTSTSKKEAASPLFQIDVNIRNMNFMAATPLYYAIASGNVGLTAMLVEAGADLTARLTLPDETELPVLFCALSPDMPPSLLEVLVRQARRKDAISSLLYRSSTLLHFALGQCVNADQLRLLLKVCNAKVIAQRNESNQLAYDLCGQEHRYEFEQQLRRRIHTIDHQFILDLVANGYNRMWDALSNAENLQSTRIRLYNGFREHIEAFVAAVEEGDLEGVRDRTLFHSDVGDICVVNCRRQGDGQPPLHKAVLRNHLAICKHICNVIRQLLCVPLDDVRDNYRRTALCYAFAMETNGQKSAQLLLDFGSSEFTMDKDNRSPLSFKERGTHPNSACFLAYHLEADFNLPEPDLWSDTSSDEAYDHMGRIISKRNHKTSYQQKMCGDAAGQVAFEPPLFDFSEEEEDNDDDEEDGNAVPVGSNYNMIPSCILL